MKEFIGHLHPLLVHLPIGILLIAIIFQFLSQKEKYQSLQPAIGVSLFLGVLSAIFSCISGYLLSNTGSYDEALVSKHQWLGIATAIISIVAYILNKKENVFTKWIMLLMGILIMITGHLGGSLTHGSDYLTSVFSNSSDNSSNTIKPVANIQEAVLYSDVIKPILQTKCYNCHGANKQKGKLRLDEENFILKGGKNGEVVIANKADESELIKRILLPVEDEDHMPPKEKPQLSKTDIDAISWWINSGINFKNKIKEIPQPEKTKPLLTALQTGSSAQTITTSIIPEKKVAKANDSVIQKIKALGAIVIPLAENTNYLSANFINANFTAKDLQLLASIKEQLIQLKLSNTKITNSMLNEISTLSSLTHLYLENTDITDEGIKYLTTLSQLQYLNLVGTKTTAKGLEQLSSLKNLTQLYIYKTSISQNKYDNLKKSFPKTNIDTGGYTVPFLATDTIVLKAPLSK